MDHKLGVTANDQAAGLRLFAPGITASTQSRTLAGPVVAFGVHGRTSRGLLKVRPGQGAPGARAGLYVLGPLSGVKLTKEHIREESRGHAAAIDFLPEGIRASMRVADGPEGDAALREAADHTRDGFSFDVIDEVIEGDELVEGRIIAIGQVGIPAYDGMRIDSIAASLHNQNNEGAAAMLTAEERARLAELLANTNRTAEEEAEYQALAARAAAEAAAVQANDGGDEEETEEETEETAEQPPAGVAASIPSVPGGQSAATGQRPGQRPAATTQPRGSAYDRMLDGLVAAFGSKKATGHNGNVLSGVTAALSDVTNTAHNDNIEQRGWQGELFDGVDFTPVWSDLLASGDLTAFEGDGYRVTGVPAMQDYAGDKAEIPTGTVTTAKESWEAARGAVGIDIDRKFFDFGNRAFLDKVFREVALTWKEMTDAKVKAFMLAEAVKSTKTISISTTNADATITFAVGTITAADVGATISASAGIPGGTTIASVTDDTHAELSANATATGARTATIDVQADTLLKAAGRVALSLNRKGPDGSKAPSNTGAEYILVNDEDMFTLMDVDEHSVPAFLDLFKIKPENFRADPGVPLGTVIGGVKKAGKLLTPAGMPLEVDALNLALGGVDKAFFGYWAILQEHLRGIQKTKFVRVAD